MELRHLRYFTAVAEELHFRRAAERLHIAQPAVSEQIRNLERELGVQLLERTKRSVSLTPAGVSLLDDARRMLRLEASARRGAQQAHAGLTGRLRLGRPPDTLPNVVPRALRLFATAHPDIEVVVDQMDPRTAVDALRNDLLDAALVCLPAPLAGLDVLTVAEESVVVAVPDGHPGLSQCAMPLDQLDGAEIAVLPRSANPPFYDGLLAAARDASLNIRLVDAPGPTVEQALMVVAAGRSLALLPSSVAGRHVLPGVRFMPLAEPAPRCVVALVTRLDLDRAHVRAFGGILSTAARRLAAAPAKRTPLTLVTSDHDDPPRPRSGAAVA